MANTIQYEVTTRNLRLDQTWDQVDAGKLRIYAGAIPASADAGLGGATLLAEFTFPNPAFIAAAAGIKVANAITSVNGLANGTATFWRALTPGLITVGQGTAGVTASGESLELNTTSIVTGALVVITGAAFAEAA